MLSRVEIRLDRLELVDHRDHQAAKIRIENFLQFGLGVGAPGRDILLLHFAEQALDPALQLPFKLGAIDDEDHRRVLKLILPFEDQLGGGEQREGLTGALRVPDEAARLLRVSAARNDCVDGPALMLAQNGLSRLAVFHIEQNPML